MAYDDDQHSTAFDGFDLSNFWQNSDYVQKEYVCEPLSDDLIASVEARLRSTIACLVSYVDEKSKWGRATQHLFSDENTTYFAKDHVGITGIFGVGRRQTYSLCGPRGSEFMRNHWKYPAWG